MTENSFFWKLRFQNGFLAGQELHLPEGQFTVGSGPHWDIDLVSLDVEDQHCVLSVRRDGVELQPLGMPCKLAKRRIKGDRVELIAHQQVEIGGCRFELLNTREPHVSPQPILPMAATSGSRPWRQVLTVAIPGTLATFLVSGMLYLSQELRASVRLPYSESFDLEQYQILLRDAGLSGVRVERDRQGIVGLSGTCKQSTALTPLIERLQQAGIPYRSTVLCQDDLIRNVAYILENNGYTDARILPGNNGHSLQIIANIKADARWQQTSRQLSQVPGLESWTVNDSHDEHFGELVEALKEKGILHKLSLVAQNGVLTITGQLNTAEKAVLDAVLELNRQYPFGRVVYQNIPVGQSERTFFAANVVSYSGTAQSAFLVLDDGTRVQTGSLLPSGYVVTALDASGAELQKEGQLVHIPLSF